mmetsp:Transcript_34698/g.40154  ORF Transcript_34698/g.40154 Transcript_34698/m.40154 type:complete len:87 (+) Transcript_34698:416-676(+)
MNSVTASKRNTHKGQEQILSAIGPLASCFDDVLFSTKMLLNDIHKEIDITVVPMNFDDAKYGKTLSQKQMKFAYIVNNGVMDSSKP